MVELVTKAGHAMKKWLGVSGRKSTTPANGTRSEVSQPGKTRMGPLGEFYRVAQLAGNGAYRSRFPVCGLYPS